MTGHFEDIFWAGYYSDCGTWLFMLLRLLLWMKLKPVVVSIS